MSAKRKVLITGTTGGLGRGLLAHYHQAGWEVTAINRRKDPAMEAQFPGARFLELDVRNREGIRAYFEEAARRAELPELYYLNAGINKADNLDIFSLDAYQEVMDINLTGVLNFVDAALPHLKEKKAVFVTSSSTSNIFPNPNNLAYHASKLAAARLFKLLDARHGTKGWSFKTLILGPIATGIASGSKLPRLQELIRDFLTVTVEDSVGAIVRFVESRRKVFYYTKTSTLFFLTAALVHKIAPRLYQGSAKPPASSAGAED